MKLIESRLRLASGLVLAAYVLQHLVNHAFGIVSIETAEAYRKTVGAVFQTLPGLVLLYGSFLFHAAIALRSIYRRSSLRQPPWQWAQTLLGLSILPLVVGHAIGNRGYDLVGGIDPNYFYVVTSMLLKPAFLVKLVILIPVIWIHLLIGLHFWLRIRATYRRWLPWAYTLAIIIPTLSFAGLYNMLRQASTWLDDRGRLDQIFAANRAMSRGDIAFLQGLESQAWIAMALLLVLTLVARQARIWIQSRRGSYLIVHAGGARVRELQGVSLLEALRNARIPHASVCGGRARCTTCRVRVGNGLDQLDPPDELEARALKRIDAEANVRLACQLYPHADLSITPLVTAGQKLDVTLQSGGVQGHEEYVVAMFVDMRGSTDLGERVLAYDVVFILNRFFNELSEALSASHGHYAQFSGDGLMALYGLDPERKPRACRDALDGAREMFRRVGLLNEQLRSDFGESVQMGIGIHGGEAIVGTMGPPKTPLLTAVGDNINIAARLEAETKALQCDLLVSAETLARENIPFADAASLEIELRGRQSRVRVCTFASDELPTGPRD
ncbi:MAG: adenylate/guanylate cyclase domain-containing protein [Gammaproteobacteria bacterium]|jgi:adenylate cyclase